MNSLWLAMALVTLQSQAQQFDLLCTGTQTYRTMDGGNDTPFSTRLRIDTTARLWCEGRCLVRFPVIAAERLILVLQDVRNAPDQAIASANTHIARNTGEYRSVISGTGASGRYYRNIRAQCEPAAFSGFPDVRTRF